MSNDANSIYCRAQCIFWRVLKQNEPPKVIALITPLNKNAQSLTSAQRAAITYLAEHGETSRVIADKVGFGKSTVGDIIRHFKATGTLSPKNSGRRKIFED